MYIDKNGIEHKFIHCLMEETGGYLPGWYFEDETNRFYNDEPFATFEEVNEAMKIYFSYLNNVNNK
jgi:hypothetical protein